MGERIRGRLGIKLRKQRLEAEPEEKTGSTESLHYTPQHEDVLTLQGSKAS